MLQPPDRANPAQIVDDFDRVVTQRCDEQIAASPVVTEVIDPPQNAGENYARPESERYGSLVCTRTRITAGAPNSDDKAEEQRCQCKTDNELDAEACELHLSRAAKKSRWRRPEVQARIGSLSARERGLDAFRGQWRASQPHAGRIEERVRHRRRYHADRRLAGPAGCDFRPVDEHNLDRLGRVADLEDRIAQPVDAGHFLAIETHLLEESARQPLHDVAFDGVADPFRIDDKAAVVRDREFPSPDAPALALDLDLRDHRHEGAVALRVGDAAAGQDVA